MNRHDLGAFRVCAMLGCAWIGFGCGPVPQNQAGVEDQEAATHAATWKDVFITWYGFNDNSCQVESQHNCNTIAFPKSDGWPVRHNIATEGKGTFDDPNTFAASANDNGGDNESGSGATIKPGTKIYVPEVRKYFVMEDSCLECTNEWNSHHSHHVDLWMGPSVGSANQPLMDCEDKLTIGDTNHGTGTIIVNPPSTLTVDTNPLFKNNKCTAHVF
jgi:hypothetical protein